MDKDLQKKLADAVSGSSLPISVKNDLTGEERSYEIKQPTLAMLLETSKHLADLEIESIEDFFNGKKVFSFMYQKTDLLIKIAAINLDYRTDYTNETFEFLKTNLTVPELYDLLSNIILRLGIGDFQKSIIASAPMSLFSQAEIIAASTRSNSLAGI